MPKETSKWNWSESRLLCLTCWDPKDYIVHGILLARKPEWVAFPFSSGSSWPRNLTGVSCTAGGFFINWAMREKSKRESKTMRLLRNKNLTKKRAWIDGWLRGGESSMDQNNLLLIKTLLLHNVVSPICLFTCVESCPPWWHLMLLMVTFFKSFLMWTIFKVFMESITILLLFFGFWSFSTRHVRSQHPLPRPGIEPVPHALEGEVPTTDCQGSPLKATLYAVGFAVIYFHFHLFYGFKLFNRCVDEIERGEWKRWLKAQH